MGQIFQLARSLGPYLLVELLLPGGSIVAALLWLLHRWRPRGDPDARTLEKHPFPRAVPGGGAPGI
jgi:hypothetical protein